jgi:SAM-dependent methyltransferase
MMTEPLSDVQREKLDTRPDASFYDSPRYVTHADEGFLDRLTDLYDSEIPADARVFDAMSSWVSNLPTAEYETVIGHGLNADELAANGRLDDWFVQDLNDEQSLPLTDTSVDAVTCALSVQYLQYPGAVFREFARILADGGVLVISFTNRMFPTKAVRAWREASMDGRVDLVCSYTDAAGAFDVQRVAREQPATDPFYAVVATRTPR